tara:strand:- start:1434 stop:1589 length:156 start_codon:yes stop_codon:yes gene_type:complete
MDAIAVSNHISQEQKIKISYFVALGFIIGLSLLAKSTAILFVFLPFMLKFI